jgi:glucuronate isomerase
MKNFLDKDFLLESETAKKLFHDWAEKMPICDYHCHLSPQEIYENKQPENISDLWLSGDHYKWRAMRSCGVDEKYCTGDATPKEKFEKFAYTLQYCIGNPLYHWAHIELQRYFGIDTPLNAKTADDIYERANKAISEGDFAPQSLIMKSNVKVVCTTDDPIDDLKYHKLLKEVDGFDCKVLPTFRPDKALNINLDGFADYIKSLGEVASVDIKNVDDVITALLNRVEYFHSVGCRVSDQAFDCPPYAVADKDEVNAVFNKAMNGEKLTDYECNVYKTPIVIALGEKYHELGWTMEVHIGAMRNNNTLMFNKLGADTGFDSVGDDNIAKPLSRLLDSLNVNDKLPKTILFNLNDKDNTVLATMLGNFQSSDAQSKVQFGPAWWFLDTMDGMTAQMKSLANLGVLGKFVGMETDSRSFTSYGRHEYFRRIMCNLIGSWVENGMYAYDEDILKEIVEGISYNNAINYFNFE